MNGGLFVSFGLYGPRLFFCRLTSCPQHKKKIVSPFESRRRVAHVARKLLAPCYIECAE